MVNEMSMIIVIIIGDDAYTRQKFDKVLLARGAIIA